MAVGSNKPRITIDNKKKYPLELCCGEICCEVAVTGSDLSQASASDKGSVTGGGARNTGEIPQIQPAGTGTGTGTGVASFVPVPSPYAPRYTVLRIALESIEDLPREVEIFMNNWK